MVWQIDRAIDQQYKEDAYPWSSSAFLRLAVPAVGRGNPSSIIP
jgi:hypothetical protein